MKPVPLAPSRKAPIPGASQGTTNPAADQGEDIIFRIGDVVAVTGTRKVGVVKFCGDVHFGEGIWVGLELPDPSGKNDGSVQGIKYFTCKPKHGLFIRSNICAYSKAPPPSKPSVLSRSLSALARPVSLAAQSATGRSNSITSFRSQKAIPTEEKIEEIQTLESAPTIVSETTTSEIMEVEENGDAIPAPSGSAMSTPNVNTPPPAAYPSTGNLGTPGQDDQFDLYSTYDRSKPGDQNKSPYSRRESVGGEDLYNVPLRTVMSSSRKGFDRGSPRVSGTDVVIKPKGTPSVGNTGMDTSDAGPTGQSLAADMSSAASADASPNAGTSYSKSFFSQARALFSSKSGDQTPISGSNPAARRSFTSASATTSNNSSSTTTTNVASTVNTETSLGGEGKVSTVTPNGINVNVTETIDPESNAMSSPIEAGSNPLSGRPSNGRRSSKGSFFESSTSSRGLFGSRVFGGTSPRAETSEILDTSAIASILLADADFMSKIFDSPQFREKIEQAFQQKSDQQTIWMSRVSNNVAAIEDNLERIATGLSEVNEAMEQLNLVSTLQQASSVPVAVPVTTLDNVTIRNGNSKERGPQYSLLPDLKDRELMESLDVKDREIQRLRGAVTTVVGLVQQAKDAAAAERLQLEDRLKTLSIRLAKYEDTRTTDSTH